MTEPKINQNMPTLDLQNNPTHPEKKKQKEIHIHSLIIDCFYITVQQEEEMKGQRERREIYGEMV